MQSFLITGSDEKGRLEKAEEIMAKKISKQENNPDFFLLQLTKLSVGVEEVKNLKRFLVLKPFREKIKIVFIKEAQNLTVEAQSALLKTLEETPKNCQIILTAPDVSFLLPTISSRCQIIQLTVKIGAGLKENEQEKIMETFNLLLSSSIGKRFKIIDEQGITKDRITATDWLNKLTCVVRQQILSYYLAKPCHCDPEPVEGEAIPTMTFPYLNILSAINKSKKYLDANCNVKLTIDNFLLDLPSKNR